MAVNDSEPLYENVINFIGGREQTILQVMTDAQAAALDALSDLSQFSYDFTPIMPPTLVAGTPASFTTPAGFSSFIQPYEPPTPPGDISGQLIADGVIDNTAGEPPDEPENLDALLAWSAPGGEPNSSAPTADYGASPTLDEVDFDDLVAPTITAPDAPDFLALPDFDEALVLPTFDSTRPEIDFAVPNSPFSFSSAAYASTLLDAVRARVTLMFDGGTGLTPSIEQAIYDRERAKNEEAAFRALQEIDTDIASSGFAIPPGVMHARRDRVRQNSQNLASATARDVRIEAHKLEIEQLRFAVTQGLACEQMLVGEYVAREDRRLRAAIFAYEAVLRVFDSQIALHNAEVEAYRADSQVYRELVQAAVEAYKARSDRQMAVANINRALADMFEAQVRGGLAQVEIYVAQINARRAKLEANAQKLEQWRLKIQAFGEKIGAFRAEWDAYGSRVQASLGRIQAGQAVAQVYNTSVAAWSTKRQADFETKRTEIAHDQLRLAKLSEDVRVFLANIESERTRMQSEAQAIDAQSRYRAADAQVEQTRSEVINRGLQLAIENARNQGAVNLQAAESNLRAFVELKSLERQSLEGIAQLYAQIGAASLSAFNLSGSLSGQVGVSTSYNYSGELA